MRDFVPSFPYPQTHVTLYGVADSFDGFVLAALAERFPQRPILHVCRHQARLTLLEQTLKFLKPDLEVLTFPAWDCLPYDRVSPKKDVLGKRVEVLTRLLKPQVSSRVLLTTAASFFQRVPPKDLYQNQFYTLKKGERITPDSLKNYFLSQGFSAVSTVREPGEFCFRGGIIDFFAATYDAPHRVDLFGEEVEDLRTFDPLTQRSQETVEEICLMPVNEVLINEQTIAHFRKAYRHYFGALGEQDPLYQAISVGRNYPGAEHWLPLFYEKLQTLLDYLESPIICFEQRSLESAKARLAQIKESYETRVNFKEIEKNKGGPIYHPLPPELLYPSLREIEENLNSHTVFHFSPFESPAETEIDLGSRPIPDFSSSRNRQDIRLFDQVKERILAAYSKQKRVMISCFSTSSKNRFEKMLQEQSLIPRFLHYSPQIEELKKGEVGLVELSLEYGFETPQLMVITEQDILGERQTRSHKKQRRSDLFIAEASSLQEGDYIVHQDHGISQFKGLLTLSISGVPHDCIVLMYEGGDKLFLPVENLEVISRYGGESNFVKLDKLGSSAWQNRKAKIKKKLLEIAEHLISLAAERQVRTAEFYSPNESLYQEFVSRFPYNETEDQERVIAEVLEDLAKGKPMDRLVCGDVGFGKTEVAMRAAFVVASSGSQVAIIVPTTLLSRQHFRNFQERLEGLGLRIEQLSRLVSAKDKKHIKEALKEGKIDIIIGTHSLLAPSSSFKKLGLVIVDEEQHFGVKQKEHLKELQKEVHLLTLSATPLPRTLQMALSGVRDLSLITTPPVDRLAVRTFIIPFDGMVIREAILREIYRGGQVFYVSPRIENLDYLAERLKILVPEAKTVIAHGQQPSTALEKAISDFYDKKYDILLSTNIIESGLDMPCVNTLIIDRADLFGLAQLYQLRGRVGRAKTRGYAYLILPENVSVSAAAQKRLEVMQTLDSLGAGFQIASHDMDIRGAGNLLGEEQSGHIREVGVELYQQMLEEAVQEVKVGKEKPISSSWSPQLNLGLPILIPDTYVYDLKARLHLYKRLSIVETEEEIFELEQELRDRFGPLPEEVSNLLQVLTLKQICRKVGVEKLEAGEKGCVVSFFNQSFANPLALVNYIQQKQGTVQVRPDQKLFFPRTWKHPHIKIEGIKTILEELSSLLARDHH
jgi:transcription-repair coupling factor (superfamily II helicase)